MQSPDEEVDVPVVLVSQVSQVQVVVEIVEIPQSLFVERTAMISGIQTVQGPQTSESLSTESCVAEKIDHETVVQNVMPNIGLDSFMDDLSSVGSKGSNHQDCEVLFHARTKRTTQQPDSSQQQKQDNQSQAARQSIRQERKKEGMLNKFGVMRKEEKQKSKSTSRLRRT